MDFRRTEQTWGAYFRQQGKITPSDTVVVPVTGHGLKAADKLEKLMSA